jgi:uncharacterized protein YjiS (DUF1127 family)
VSKNGRFHLLPKVGNEPAGAIMLANANHREPRLPASAMRKVGSMLAAALLRRLRRFARAWRHRRDLELVASFDDHMLADIGLTRGDLNDAIAERRWRDPTALLAERVCERRVGRATTVLADRVFGAAGKVRVSATNPQAATALLNW